MGVLDEKLLKFEKSDLIACDFGISEGNPALILGAFSCVIYLVVLVVSSFPAVVSPVSKKSNLEATSSFGESLFFNGPFRNFVVPVCWALVIFF